jgi:aldehyde:ferredoxin oxidoreductase
MYGWMGKILRINLSNGEINEEALDPQVIRDFVGGRGLAIYYMIKEVDPNCDALGKENKLIMTTGPLTGTKAPTGSRYMVTTKSPLTNASTRPTMPCGLRPTTRPKPPSSGRLARNSYFLPPL